MAPLKKESGTLKNSTLSLTSTLNRLDSIFKIFITTFEPKQTMKNLTNRLNFAGCLFSYRSQMTSKCGKNKKIGTRDAGSNRHTAK